MTDLENEPTLRDHATSNGFLVNCGGSYVEVITVLTASVGKVPGNHLYAPKPGSLESTHSAYHIHAANLGVVSQLMPAPYLLQGPDLMTSHV